MGKSKITAEIAQAVCDELALGDKSLRAICSEKGFTASAFIQRTYDDTELAKQYACALDAVTDVEFADLRDELSEIPPKDDSGRVDSGWVNWKRLQIDTKKWSWARRTPKSARKYGEKTTVAGDPDAPIGVQYTVKSILDKE